MISVHSVCYSVLHYMQHNKGNLSLKLDLDRYEFWSNYLIVCSATQLRTQIYREVRRNLRQYR